MLFLILCFGFGVKTAYCACLRLCIWLCTKRRTVICSLCIVCEYFYCAVFSFIAVCFLWVSVSLLCFCYMYSSSVCSVVWFLSAVYSAVSGFLLCFIVVVFYYMPDSYHCWLEHLCSLVLSAPCL